MMRFRAALLATALSAGAMSVAPAWAASEPSAAAPAAALEENSALVRATAPPASADRDYAQPMDALLAADLDSVVTSARRERAGGDDSPVWSAVIFLDELAADDLPGARAALQSAPDGINGGVGDMYEPFLLLAEGQPDRAIERIDHGLANLPEPMPGAARALIYEGAGRLQEAAAIYAQLVSTLDTTPLPEGEPQSEEDFMRALAVTRTVQILYRAALVNQRLGATDEAARLYELVEPFAPNSADVLENRARLARGEPPLEPPLDAKRALGRWLFLLSDYLTNTEGVLAILANPEGVDGLASPTSSMFLQFGILLDPAAQDWTLAAANQLLDARAYDGALRVLDRIPDSAVFAAEAQLSRANIFLKQREDAQANAAAEDAERLGGSRWTVLSGAGDVFRATGRDRAAITAHTRALELVSTPEDRAKALSYRAYAHYFAGRPDAAVNDIRQALQIERTDDIRYMAVTVMMEHPDQWRDGISIAREMFAERPDSGARLNSLGYSLIQRPEGLEEGYRLLWRGFSYRSFDYAVIDSLGWAYYLYGHIPEARALIERANELSADDPNPEVLDHLGDIYWRLDMRTEARDAWRQALEARPDARRREALEGKIRRGLRTPAPVQRELPRVNLPEAPSTREET